MSVGPIEIAKVDAGGRLRPINPAWVEAMAEEIGRGATPPPIEVVERGEGYRLIAGGHRIAAAAAAGRTEIEARVWPADAFADEAAIRLREIQENMVRYELTALDRAVHLAAWKEIYETVHLTNKHGGKRRGAPAAIKSQDPATRTSAAATPIKWQDPATCFAERFSAAAARVLQISERSIRDAISIAAGIGPAIRERIAAAPIADNASELRLLAQQHPNRQGRIVDLLLGDRPAASSVEKAIAILDQTPPPAASSAVDRVSERFARLKERERDTFFELHRDDIERWLAGRRR